MSAQIPGGRTLDVCPADAVYNSQSNRLYALLNAKSALYPQSVTEIDPDSLSTLRSAPLPQPAALLRMSADGLYLYAVANTAPSVVYRIPVISMTVDATYTPTYPGVPSSRISDLLPFAAVRTRLPRTLGAVPEAAEREASAGDTFVASFMVVGTAAFEGSTPLPHVLTGRPISELVATADPTVIYGYDGVDTGFGLSPIRITAKGLEYIGGTVSGAASGFGTPLQVYNGLLYAVNGTVFDVTHGRPAGFFTSADEITYASAFAIDGPNNRIYFTTQSGNGAMYLAQDMTTFLPVSYLYVKNATGSNFNMPGPAFRMLLTNQGDLVVFDGSASQLLFIPASALPLYAAWEPPAVQQIAPFLRLLAYPASYLAADPVNQKLLATLQGGIPGTGNSLLTIDPVAGTVVSRDFAGPAPGTRPPP